MTDTPTIWLIDGTPRAHHYTRICQQFNASWIVGELSDSAALESIDLAMVSEEFDDGTVRCLRRAQSSDIPVLHIMDGIIEWRNTWENPRSRSPDKGTPIYQPILSDKVACLGRLQGRILESWGNLGRCEIVGSPRLDEYLDLVPRKCGSREPFRVLVMTARTPAFTSQQREAVKCGLIDVQAALRKQAITKRRCEVIWRVSDGLGEELNLQSDVPDLDRRPLIEVLQQVDAVVTTPSTAMLEAMLVGLPVALLDYTNSPAYVAAAWLITAPQHIQPAISDLQTPPVNRMLFQDMVLHDALECRTAATPRAIELMDKMIYFKRQSHRSGERIRLPARILTDELCGGNFSEDRFDLEALYPDYPQFRRREMHALQVELVHLQRYISSIESSRFYRLWRRWLALRRYFARR